MSEPIVRPLEGDAELRACVALQRLTWGPGFSDVVPVSVLMLARELGGVVSGAFMGGELVGFVFGLTGLRDGRLAHWSDMLAVHPDHRGLGLGLRLKLHQRELLLERDVGRVYWTFDPLVARNARLNLSRLGATASTYRRDLYGETGSPLHAGVGTDRLVAEWELDSDRVRRRVSGDVLPPAPSLYADLPLLNPPALSGPFPRPANLARSTHAERVRLAVPSDIDALKRADLPLAVAWRAHLREAFETLFEGGYLAVELVRDEEGVSSYVLTRGLVR